MKRTKMNALAISSLAVALALPGMAGAAAPVAVTKQEASSAAGQTTGASRVPVRAVAEALGCRIEWDAAKRTVTLARDAVTVELVLGSERALINGEPFGIGQPVLAIGDRAYVPLDVLNNAFGTDIGWDEANKSALFKKDDYAGIASNFVQLLFGDDYGQLRPLISEPLAQTLSVGNVAAIASNYPQIYGTPAKRLSASVTANDVHTNARLVYETDGAVPLAITVRFDGAGLVDDLDFTALTPAEPYRKPAYDKGDYTEQEVVVGEGEYALPGTLTLPQGTGPYPVAILVQGSGPQDRDSSIGGAKVFRDLAVGLASQGIASLRYEKVTKEHTFKIAIQPKFTIENETVDDVIKAIELLKGRQDIDASRIFAVGHSQGGFMAPKMIEQDASGSLAGAILLSAPSGTFMDVLVEQQSVAAERMEELGMPEALVAQQKQAAVATESLAKLLYDPEYSADNMPPNFPLQPAYWWFEQRDYVAATLAAKQSKPMLILQGENDWQVSMKQFEGWKTALKDRHEVEYHSYPKVNHLLEEYDGLSIGAEYNAAANVSPAIIADMAAWILKMK